MRAVGRQAERQKTQERPEVHVSGAGQLGGGDRWTPGQQVGIAASTHPFTQNLPLRGSRSRGRGVGHAQVRWGGALQVQQEAVHVGARI